MLHIRRIIFGLLLLLLRPSHEGSAASVQPKGNDVAKTISTGEPTCNKDADCTLTNSRCVNSVCTCTDGYVLDGSWTACIEVATAYGNNCTDSIQCSNRLFNGGACVNNTCVCIDGYYYLNGRCNAYSGLFGKCKKDIDCYVHADYGSVYCNNGKCECSSGYYQREYRTCRPEGKKVGDDCTINSDCKFSATASCSENKCVEADTGSVTESFFELNVLQTENATEAKPDMSNCTTDESCKHINNAECSPLGKCVCKRAYFYASNTCVPELGELCNAHDTSAITDAVCKNGKWNCNVNKIISVDNQMCSKAVRTYNFSCLQNEQCSIFGPDGICKNGGCVCNDNSHFVESDVFCWTKKGFNETCQQDLDCYLNGAQEKLSCKDSVCVCRDGTHINENHTDCLENYTGIGSKCNNTSDCQPQDSECKENICSCKDNYVSDSFKSCVPVATFGQPCETDIQCSTTVPNAVCLGNNSTDENKTCKCKEGDHFKFNRCNIKKVLGESCKNLGECYLNSNEQRVRCRNDRCACDYGYFRLNDTVCAIQSLRHNNTGNNTATSISGRFSLIAMPILLLTSYHSLSNRY